MTRVSGLAEIVLWVRDMQASLRFYRDRLGMEVISPPALANKFLKAAEGKHGIPEMIVLVPHPDSSHDFPRQKPLRVLHHMAFRLEAGDYDELEAGLRADGVEVRSGVHPVLQGVRTFYCDDPDGNEVELIAPA